MNGRDWRGWPTLPIVDAPAAVRLTLQRIDAQQVADEAREALKAAHADLVEAWLAAGGTDFDDVAAVRS